MLVSDLYVFGMPEERLLDQFNLINTLYRDGGVPKRTQGAAAPFIWQLVDGIRNKRVASDIVSEAVARAYVNEFDISQNNGAFSRVEHCVLSGNLVDVGRRIVPKELHRERFVEPFYDMPTGVWINDCLVGSGKFQEILGYLEQIPDSTVWNEARFAKEITRAMSGRHILYVGDDTKETVSSVLEEECGREVKVESDPWKAVTGSATREPGIVVVTDANARVPVTNAPLIKRVGSGDIPVVVYSDEEPADYGMFKPITYVDSKEGLEHLAIVLNGLLDDSIVRLRA